MRKSSAPRARATVTIPAELPFTSATARSSRYAATPAHFVSQGQLCTKCSIGYNNEWLDPRARLTRPLRRIGRKGEGRFEPVSWEVAIAAIADRLKRIAAGAGPQAILNTHYSGTISLIAYLFPTRFFNRLGATEVSPDTICNMAGHVALHYVYGTSVSGFDPRTGAAAACILVWGANPSASGPHVQEHWIENLPGKVVVIDPVRTASAAAADIHLQPFPGSDAALAFSMLHVIQREGLVDRDFVAQHTVGWDELEPMLAPCTPAWGEAQTGVPARLIEETARLYGRGPSLLWMGQALQRQPTGGNVMRACSILPAVTGNIGKPGTGFVYLNFDMAQRGIDGEYLTAPHLSKNAPPSISQMDLAACLEDPARAQALMCWNINIAASNPQQERLRKALMREDLMTVVLDLFPTDTTDFADFVLPAASFLEFDDLVASYFHLTLSAQVKAAEPMGEALPNSEIFRRLARAMDFTEPELHESDSEIIATLLEARKPRRRFSRVCRARARAHSRRADDPVSRSDFPDAQWTYRNRFRERRGRRPSASSAAARRSQAGVGTAAIAVAIFGLEPERQLLERGQNSGSRGPGRDRDASSGRRRPRSRGRRPGAGRERNGPPGDARHLDRKLAARCRAVAQGPLAQAGSRAKKRERVEPRAQVGHGGKHCRAQRGGYGGPVGFGMSAVSFDLFSLGR